MSLCVFYVYVHIGLVVLKKYCNFFWKSFPKDYSVTLARFCETSSKEINSDDNIATCSSLEIGNMKILFLCMTGVVEGDDDLLIFGDIMEEIIDNPKLSKIVEVFKEGKIVPLSFLFTNKTHVLLVTHV